MLWPLFSCCTGSLAWWEDRGERGGEEGVGGEGGEGEEEGEEGGGGGGGGGGGEFGSRDARLDPSCSLTSCSAHVKHNSEINHLYTKMELHGIQGLDNVH